MKNEDILDVIYREKNANWTDAQIGRFVRKALYEDISEEDLEKEINGEYEG